MRYSRDQTHCGSQTHVKCTQPGGTLPELELKFKHSCAQCLYKQYFRDAVQKHFSKCESSLDTNYIVCFCGIAVASL